jgi:ABC-type multidrug transport system fused ATPase/permease subunit
MIFFNGLLQLVGVTSVFPFFALAADPDRIRNSKAGRWILNLFPPMDTDQLLVAAGCFSIGMLVFASVGSILSEVIRIRYAWGFCHWLRSRLLESYEKKPYGFFLRRNSAALAQKLTDIQTFINSVLLPIGEVLTRLLLVTLLVIGVIFVQPWVALGAVLILGGFYLTVFIWVRPRTRMLGEGFERHNVGFLLNTQQFLHGIKTAMVYGRGRYFMDRAMEHSARLGHVQSMVPIYDNGPRYLIEPIAFGGLVAVVLVMDLQGRPFSDILPNLSVMALAGYRLIPALQLLFSQLVSITIHSYTLLQLEEEMIEIEGDASDIPTTPFPAKPPTFKNELRLDGISFSYPGAISPIIRDFSLLIRKNESIGIAGFSGSGKSTLVDLILGLHTPDKGELLLDGEPLSGASMNSWRRMIGYVPQDIYMLDASIEENIAFGVDPAAVDQAALRKAAEGAQILEYIERDLPNGFKTKVGERGVRLSGGQRQRIGLARALYGSPQVLILDEATSALDQETEKAVMETIGHLQGTLTIISIAHRLSTLEHCDRIVRLGMPGGRMLEKARSGI